jgi:hypothetical protein
MRLVHVVTGLCGCLFARSCCSIGISIECLETGYKGICTNLNGCRVCELEVGGDELLKVLDGGVLSHNEFWMIWSSLVVRSLIPRHVGVT